MKSITNQCWYPRLLIVAAAIAAMMSVILFYIPFSNDSQQHYQFALTFYDTISAGDFFPGWSAKSNFGFGSIGIRFYPPLGYYVFAFFRFVSGDWYEASWLTFTFWMILSGLGVYLWMREWLGEKGGILSGTLYVFMPSHLMEIYNHFLYGEFVSSAILPFCFAFVSKVCLRGNRIDVIGLSITFALLCLAHLPGIIIASPCLLLYALAIINWQTAKKTLFKLSLSVSLALISTSFYWLRVVTELSYVNHSAEVSGNSWYHYQNHFLPFLLYAPETYYWEGRRYLDLVLLLTFLLILPLYCFFVADKIKNRENAFHHSKILRAILLLATFSLFLMTPLSKFVWANLPLLQKIQFPWRFLIVFSLAAVGAFSFIVTRVTNNGFQRAVGYPYILLLLAIMIFNITQTIAPGAYEPYSREKLTNVLPKWLNGESNECWWAVWSKRAAFENKSKVSTISRAVEIQIWADEKREFSIESGKQEQARIATFYYPHWQAEVNGQKVEIQRDEDGTILIPLPPERANIKLYFQEPLLLQIAGVLSFLTWIFVLAVSSLYFVRNRRQAAKS